MNTWSIGSLTITPNCCYTSSSIVMNELEIAILNETAITVLQNMPFKDFLLPDIANLISFFEYIVQIVNQKADNTPSSKIATIKKSIFFAYSLLMNETSFLLMQNSSLLTINK